MVDYGFRSSSILDLDLLGLPKNGTTSLPCPNLAFLLVLLLLPLAGLVVLTVISHTLRNPLWDLPLLLLFSIDEIIEILHSVSCLRIYNNLTLI